MFKLSLKSLTQAAREVYAGKSPEERLASLTAAFELFTQQSEKLERAYGELKGEVQKTNAELDATTYYLNSILSHMAQGLIFIDFQGIVTTYNRAAEELFKIPNNKVLFKSFWNAFDDAQFGFSMREALAKRQVAEATYPALNHTGQEKRELAVESSFIFHTGEKSDLGNEALQGMIVLIRDVTNVRKWQTIAARHERLKGLGEMAAMAAHEIRNPLGGIKGFASLLQRDLKTQPALQKMATHIVEGTDNLNKVVNTILDYARPINPVLEPTDLTTLLTELKTLVTADTHLNPAIHIETLTPLKTLIVAVDRQLLKAALLNLMSNSIKALQDGGKIALSAYINEGQACLEIKDTGCGISPENLDKLFSPFFTTRPDGNGFGLAEVLKIVQAHGGTVAVSSTLGQGTVFTLKIPLK